MTKPMTLYVRRDVVNADNILKHYRDQGVQNTLNAEDLHVTVIFSRPPVDWMKSGASWESEIVIAAGGPRLHAMFGDSADAFVLQFANWSLKHRNEVATENGASWDWSRYQPHITIAYGDRAIDMETVRPWTGTIKLGPEIFEQVDEDWKSKVQVDA